MPSDPNIKTEPQADAILPASEAPTPAVPEDSPEAAFAKLGGKKVRGATPKPAEPVPDKLAAVAGAKFVGKIPWKE